MHSRTARDRWNRICDACGDPIDWTERRCDAGQDGSVRHADADCCRDHDSGLREQRVDSIRRSMLADYRAGRRTAREVVGTHFAMKRGDGELE
jgi:hypothetical protein